jgi:hypothetical protein
MSNEAEVLQWLSMAGITVSLILTVFYSYKSRRSADGRLRGLFAARMNICMGIMLLFISLIQIFYPGSTLRVIIGAIFMLLGLFNLFAGIRNHGYFSRLK